MKRTVRSKASPPKALTQCRNNAPYGPKPPPPNIDSKGSSLAPPKGLAPPKNCECRYLCVSMFVFILCGGARFHSCVCGVWVHMCVCVWFSCVVVVVSVVLWLWLWCGVWCGVVWLWCGVVWLWCVVVWVWCGVVVCVVWLWCGCDVVCGGMGLFQQLATPRICITEICITEICITEICITEICNTHH